MTETAEDVKRRFLRDLQKRGTVDRLGGLFAEWTGADGFIEEVVRPQEGGTFCKVYGCSYLFKGYPYAPRLHGLELSKSLISTFPKDILGKSVIYIAAIALKFLAFPNRFFHEADIFINEIVNKVVRWNDIPANEYNDPVKEIKRVTLLALKEVFSVDYDSLVNPIEAKKQHSVLGHLIARFARFLFLFLEMDTAYRWRMQDAFSNVDNDKAREDGVKEFFRLLDIMNSREVAGKGLKQKWDFAKIVLRVVFFRVPKLREFITVFLTNLNGSEIQLDEDDWYFCLKYVSYNFGGLEREERFLLRERADVQKGHVFLDL